MSKLSKDHPYPTVVDAFADELAKLDSAHAHAAAAQAQEMLRKVCLRQEIQKGRESGAPLEEDEVFEQLLAEADAKP